MNLKRRVGRLRPLPCPACRGRPTLARAGADPCQGCGTSPDVVEEMVIRSREELRAALDRASAEGVLVLGALAYLG